MKILQVSTYDISGGAARATYRLQTGLREMGHDCRMLVRYKDTKNGYVHAISREPGAEEGMQEFFLGRVMQEHYIKAHRTGMSNTMFSLPYPGYDITPMPVLNEADVINLHWVAQYQSPVTLRNLCSLGKPVVWTLHDQWAFTGGCHYTAGCEKYQSDCARCPQLSDDLSSIPSAVLKDKRDLFNGIAMTFVTPSRWMADCLRKSRLFCDRRIDVIPNSLETDIFSPLSKETAKEALGLEKGTVTFLFGGEDGNERRKGFIELVSAVNYLKEKSEFKTLLETKQVCVLCFGRPSEALDSMNIPVVALGYLGSDVEIRNAYCAADVFVLPSLEDNLPNTVLEAMSCGTPVVGFEIGGMPEMVDNGITGQLVTAGDTVQLGEAIFSLLLDSNRRREMGEKCRQKIEAEYPLHVQASRYSALYEELISENKAKTPARVSENDGPRECSFGENLVSSAPLEPALGPYFEEVYDAVLFNALKESAFQIYQDWQDAESDRTTRFQVIQDQGKRIVDLEAEVDRWLNESKQLQDYRNYLLGEVDRWLNESKRLQDYVNDLLSQQRELEIKGSMEAKNLRDEIKVLEDRIVDIEADRIARLEVINDQGERMAELEAEVDHWLGVINDQGERMAELEAEVDHWLNECRRLQKELELKTASILGRISLRAPVRKLSLLSGHLREGLLSLKEVRDKHLARDAGLNRTPKGGTAKGDESGKRNREQTASHVALASFKKKIDVFNTSQPNRQLLDGIRLFNHSMVDQFNGMFPLKGCIFLDVGASPHGYALECALACGVAFYAGIGLDINETEYVSGEGDNVGMLLNMDAADLKFPDGMFDAIFSISAFEHVSEVPRALSEISRVMRVGGCALISFEPVWSCSYGHHLHHFAECGDLVPAWGHLAWSPDQMRDYLSGKWPSNAPLSLDEAIDWIYHGDSINRLNIRQFKELFHHCGLTVSWCMDLKDEQEKYDPFQVRKACAATGLNPDELMTKGLCVLLTKEPPQK